MEARRQSVLVAIDDDEDSLRFISAAAERAGMLVFGFTKAAEALERLQTLEADCILLDFQMPGINGLEICMRLRSLPAFQTVPIIFLSADEDKKRVMQALTAGANDYLTKPLQAQELLVRLETHLELHLQRQRVLKDREVLERRNEENVILNTRSLMLQEVIKQYTPRSTWEKADFAAGAGMTDIVDEEVDLVFFFLDIRGFTHFSESHSASEVIESLNQILSPVTDIIYGNDGDVDKFIGDSIFATFQDPVKAVRATIQALRAVDARNKQRMSSGREELAVRMGLNSGRAIRGNVGSSLRKENTIIGDAVNVASRLEQACSPGRALISDALYQRVKSAMDGELLVSKPYRLRVRGKTDMIRVYFLDP